MSRRNCKVESKDLKLNTNIQEIFREFDPGSG